MVINHVFTSSYRPTVKLSVAFQATQLTKWKSKGLCFPSIVSFHFLCCCCGYCKSTLNDQSNDLCLVYLITYSFHGIYVENPVPDASQMRCLCVFRHLPTTNNQISYRTTKTTLTVFKSTFVDGLSLVYLGEHRTCVVCKKMGRRIVKCRKTVLYLTLSVL